MVTEVKGKQHATSLATQPTSMWDHAFPKIDDDFINEFDDLPAKSVKSEKLIKCQRTYPCFQALLAAFSSLIFHHLGFFLAPISSINM